MLWSNINHPLFEYGDKFSPVLTKGILNFLVSKRAYPSYPLKVESRGYIMQIHLLKTVPLTRYENNPFQSKDFTCKKYHEYFCSTLLQHGKHYFGENLLSFLIALSIK